MGYSADSWTTCRPGHVQLEAAGDARRTLVRRAPLPVMTSDDSSGMRLAASKTSSDTLPLKIDRLDEARPVADAQELQLAFAGLELEPALEGDLFAGVAGDVFDADNLGHECSVDEG